MFGRYEDYFKSFFIKQLEYDKEMYKKTHNKRLREQIEDLRNFIYKTWLIEIEIDEIEKTEIKQLELEF